MYIFLYFINWLMVTKCKLQNIFELCDFESHKLEVEEARLPRLVSMLFALG